MTVRSAYLGEDVTLTILYDGGGTDPDAAPTITITDNSAGTEVISAVSMTSEAVGEYSYGWDTSADANGASRYVLEIEAEFDSSTKIGRAHV